ncbi:MAG: hypothetical protein E7649_04000 [Ruminococcaceae bacterium]|nr:hypothetical protein [Oscillospiraceae bacterium]
MYDNIGKKIKSLAKALFIIFIVIGVIGGIVLVSYDLILLGIFTMIILPLTAWISSWFLYGFGEIIDKLTDIEHNTHVSTATARTERKNIDDKIKKLENLRTQSLITDDEYQVAISKIKEV